jgi:hypothetical protein
MHYFEERKAIFSAGGFALKIKLTPKGTVNMNSPLGGPLVELKRFQACMLTKEEGECVLDLFTPLIFPALIVLCHLNNVPVDALSFYNVVDGVQRTS